MVIIMKCDKVKELMPFLDDGSLEPETEDSARRHMLKCEACRKEYNELKFFLDGVRTVITQDTTETVPGYLGIVRRKIRKQKTVRILSHRILPAAAVFVFFVSLVLYTLMGERSATIKNLQEGVAQTTDDIELIGGYNTVYSLNEYDLHQLVDVDTDTPDQVMINALLSNSIVDVGPEDIIELMDDNQLYAALASYGR